MSSRTEVKLLTLLNVTAIKKPRALDKPGGQRGSLDARSTSTPQSPQITNGALPAANGGDITPCAVELLSTATAAGPSNHDQPVLKKRKSVVFAGEVGPSGSTYVSPVKALVNGKGKGKGKGREVTAVIGSPMRNGSADPAAAPLAEGVEEEDDPKVEAEDMFHIHFGPTPDLLDPQSISKVGEDSWTSEPTQLAGYGKAVTFRPEGGSQGSIDIQNRITPSILSSSNIASSPLVTQAVSHLGSYKDYYLHSLDDEADGSEKILYGPQKEAVRKAITVHALNHVLKTRRRIIRNNEKMAHVPDGQDPPEPPRDQSFTRPKILMLLPLRSLALHYLTAHFFPLAPPGTQIENLRPFTSSFSLSSDLNDPLASPSALTQYAADHIVNFQGNSDDNFRFGIKVTRKAWRIVMMPADEAKLLDCDFIIGSPLGMKMAAEKEKSTDMLSSIEICVADGLDVMQMQNWDHVQFIFDNLNKIPDDPHGCDFLRVKPWYLDEQARYLRQTILLSRYDTPEARALFHRHCLNLAGKIRLEDINYAGLLDRVKFGVRQTFERIDLEGQQDMEGEEAASEVENRLQWFTKKTIPSIIKSAMTRQNTLIVVPSYFDFVRLTNYLRKDEVISFAAISEYSSNSEISRARTEFFKGKKPFLILTERFHFYRRYKIRGAKTIVFYSLPDHAQFYSEFLETPFLPSQKVQKAQRVKEQKKLKRKRKVGDEAEPEDSEDEIALLEDEEDEVDPDDVSCRVLFSRFDYLKLERVVGTVNARLMLTKGEPKFQFM